MANKNQKAQKPAQAKRTPVKTTTASQKNNQSTQSRKGLRGRSIKAPVAVTGTTQDAIRNLLNTYRRKTVMELRAAMQQLLRSNPNASVSQIMKRIA